MELRLAAPGVSGAMIIPLRHQEGNPIITRPGWVGVNESGRTAAGRRIVSGAVDLYEYEVNAPVNLLDASLLRLLVGAPIGTAQFLDLLEPIPVDRIVGGRTAYGTPQLQNGVQVSHFQSYCVIEDQSDTELRSSDCFGEGGAVYSVRLRIKEI